MIYNAKSVFLEVNASLHWLNKVSCLFLSFQLSQVEYYCSLIKLDCLAACIAVWLVLYWYWREIHFLRYKIIGALKKFKKWIFLYSVPELTHILSKAKSISWDIFCNLILPSDRDPSYPFPRPWNRDVDTSLRPFLALQKWKRVNTVGHGSTVQYDVSSVISARKAHRYYRFFQWKRTFLNLLK
jgi:hypothetical protein